MYLTELGDIERREAVTLARILTETLAAPEDTWRLFELWAIIKLANSIGAVSGSAVQLFSIMPSEVAPVARIGAVELFWQYHHKDAGDPEEAELSARSILTNYGIDAREDRPDVVVVRDGRTIGLSRRNTVRAKTKGIRGLSMGCVK